MRPLSRRIATILPFPDYSIDELMESAGLLAWCALVGIIACVVIDVLLSFLRPQYSLIHNAESGFGRGPYFWVMDLNFLRRCALSLSVVGARPPATLAAVEAARGDITDAGGVNEVVVAAGDTLTVDVRLADEA